MYHLLFPVMKADYRFPADVNAQVVNTLSGSPANAAQSP